MNWLKERRSLSNKIGIGMNGTGREVGDGKRAPNEEEKFTGGLVECGCTINLPHNIVLLISNQTFRLPLINWPLLKTKFNLDNRL